MSKFKSGDRILCINDAFPGKWPIVYPKLMEVYTVDRVLYDGAITLCEIDFSPVEKLLLEAGKLPEPGFWPWHFVKIDDESALIEVSVNEEKVRIDAIT